MGTIRVAAVAVLFLGLASPIRAQRHQLTVEGSVFRGAVGYARHVSARSLLGVEAGFGFPQIDRTLEPPRDEATGEPGFEEYLHVAAFLRHAPGEHFEVDAGARAALADLWSCRASDCWPVPFGGGYLQPMAGWRNVKLGVRLVAGWAGEGEDAGPNENTFVVALNPLIVRATFRW
jgi:hypothetical protein